MDDNGFEPKCKLCNCKFQDKIENMRENNKTYKDIKEFMRINGEDISLMAISRHFNKHYLVKMKQLEAKNLQKQKKLENNKKIIQETTKSFPYLEEILNKEVSEYDKTRITKPDECLPKTFKDVFLNEYGYCTSGYRFCNNVPKKQVYCSSDVLFNLDMELSQLTGKSTNSKLILHEKQLKCVHCITFYNDCFIEFIIYSLLRSTLGNKIEVEDLKRNYINNFECDHQKAYNSLRNSLDKSEEYI